MTCSRVLVRILCHGEQFNLRVEGAYFFLKSFFLFFHYVQLVGLRVGVGGAFLNDEGQMIIVLQFLPLLQTKKLLVGPC